MSQTMPSSYKDLFDLLDQCDDPVEYSILERIKGEYDERHKQDFAKIEAFANDNVGLMCPRCGSREKIAFGKTKNGTKRFRCSGCGRTYNAASRTPFFASKVNVSAWMSFLECLLSGSSVKTACVTAKISRPTGSAWMAKIFEAIEHYQDSILFSGRIWIDETYVDVNSSDRVEKDEIGKIRKVRQKPRGISRNKICLLGMTDGAKCAIFVCGTGRPRRDKNLEVCRGHIAKGSTIVGDIDTSMSLTAESLGLKREMYKSNTYEAYEKLAPIDGVCDRFKLFVRKHRGFNKKKLQNWCNLFVFMENEKSASPDIFLVSEKLIKLIIKTDKTRK